MIWKQNFSLYNLYYPIIHVSVYLEPKASNIDPLEIIAEHYPPQSKAYDILIRHGELVAGKALRIADRAGNHALDADFIWKAAMLHDIGIFMTHAPSIGCHGAYTYLCHGYLGRELLEKKGCPYMPGPVKPMLEPASVPGK